MADNALLFQQSGSTYVGAGSPAALDDLSAFTAIVLARATFPSYGGLISKGNGWDTFTEGWSLGISASEVQFSRFHASGDQHLINTSGSTFSSNTWYWIVAACSATDSEVMTGAFGASVTSRGNDTATNALITDAGYNCNIGSDRSSGSGYLFDNGIAFAGILSGKKTVAQVNAILADMASQSWLLGMRVNGDGTVTNVGTSGSLTKNGSFGTLITDAPTYWTGGATGPVNPWRNTKLVTSVARNAALW